MRRLLKERSPNPAPNQILLKWHSLQQSNSQLKQTITEKTQQLSGDPAEFFEQIIGFKPYSYQREFAELFEKNQFTVAR